MLVRLRRGYGNLVTSGAQLVLIFIGLQTESVLGMAVCLGLMAPVSLVAWTSAYRRTRAIDDTPTSRIASAAQGYAELIGRGKALAGAPLISPVSQLPCLWYRYTIERRDSDNKWHMEEQGESDASFILDDGTGECVVDPEGAEMLISKKDTWMQGERRYTQWLLIERQTVYALGQFVTRGSVDLALDVNQDVGQLLADWKKQPGGLLQRFDLDGSGELDLREWELARAQARREVLASHRELHSSAELHLMQRPGGRRHYIISDLDPAGLARRYKFWAWFHLAVFFGALIALPYVWRMEGGF